MRLCRMQRLYQVFGFSHRISEINLKTHDMSSLEKGFLWAGAMMTVDPGLRVDWSRDQYGLAGPSVMRYTQMRSWVVQMICIAKIYLGFQWDEIGFCMQSWLILESNYQTKHPYLREHVSIHAKSQRGSNRRFDFSVSDRNHQADWDESQ